MSLYEDEEVKEFDVNYADPVQFEDWLDSQDATGVEKDTVVNLFAGDQAKWKSKKELRAVVNIYVLQCVELGDIEKERVEEYANDMIKEIIQKRSRRVGSSSIIITPEGYAISVTKNGNTYMKKLTNFTMTNFRETTIHAEHVYIVDIERNGSVHRNVILDGVVMSKVAEFRIRVRKSAKASLDQDISPREFQALIDFIDNSPKKFLMPIPYLGVYYTKDKIPYLINLKKEEGSEIKRLEYIHNESISEVPESFPAMNTADIDYKFSYPECAEDEWQQIGKTLLDNIPYLNDYNKMMVMLAWFSTTFLKHMTDREDEILSRFPLLSVVGTPGSGKTTLVKLLARMFGFIGDGGASFTKAFTTIKNLAESNSHFHWVDEYKVDNKASKESSINFASLLRRAYDSGYDERGSMDQTKNTYYFRTPVVVSGESAFSDQALLERSIVVTFSKEDTERNYKNNANYNNIAKLGEYNAIKFSNGYIKWLFSNHKDWKKWVLREQEEMLSRNIELNDRMVRSIVWIRVGMRIINKIAVLCDSTSKITDNDVEKVTDYMISVSKRSQTQNSLEGVLMEFLASEWTKGLKVPFSDQETTTILKKDKEHIVFHMTAWVSRFQQYCRKTDKGEQTNDIIMRTLQDLSLKECVLRLKETTKMDKSSKRIFEINTKKVSAMFGIPPEMWEYEGTDTDPEKGI